MNPHFFTAPLLCFHLVQGSRFKVQGSGVRWRLSCLFLENGILVSQPSPLGKGADRVTMV